MSQEALEALARAYDREDASQRGEPTPWDDVEDLAWKAERIACAQVGLAAYLASSPEGRQEAAVLDVAAKIIARTMCVMECENPDDRCPGRDGTIAARWEHRLTWAKTALDAALPHIIPAKPAVEVVEALKRAKKALSRIEAIANDRSEKAWFRLESIADEAHFAIIDAALQAPATPDAQTEVEKAAPSGEIPGKMEMFDGELRSVVDASRSGWFRFHHHRDRDGYCDNPSRGY